MLIELTFIIIQYSGVWDTSQRMTGENSTWWFAERIENGLATVNQYVPLTSIGSDSRNFVLMYHSVTDDPPLTQSYGNVTPERFERDLQHLSREYTISDVDTTVERSNQERKHVALTFDDGFRNFYDRVVPLLRKYDAPATVFVSPGLISDPDRAQTALELSTADTDLFMNEQQLTELSDEPLVTIGNHTQTHQDLTTLEPDEQRTEINQAKAELEGIIDDPVRRFAYPYGMFDATSSEIVSTGHDLAVSVSAGPVEADCDLMRIPRLLAHVPAARLQWDVADLRWRLLSSIEELSAGKP